MQRIGASILIVFLVLQSCSVVKRSAKVATAERNVLLTDAIKKGNLTDGGFNIIKADVEIESEEDNQKFMVSVKYGAGKYLVSLRSRTGIEAGRIFMDDDTILINDRINKILYFGKPEQLVRLIGFPGNLLPALLGDYVTIESDADTIRCNENSTEIMENLNGIKLTYVLDCTTQKVKEIIQESSYGGIENDIKLTEFTAAGEKIFARKINISNSRSGTSIIIAIDKIEIPWSGAIDFVPGNNYEMKELR